MQINAWQAVYIVITLLQSILNIWKIRGLEMDLVLDNSLHYF